MSDEDKRSGGGHTPEPSIDIIPRHVGVRPAPSKPPPDTHIPIRPAPTPPKAPPPPKEG